jgi:hypothetical protein
LKIPLKGLDWLDRSDPQHATLSSLFTPQLWLEPVLTLLKTPVGGLDRPYKLDPQHATLLSLLTPQV